LSTINGGPLAPALELVLTEFVGLRLSSNAQIFPFIP
jgi:hypothetical protein